jgi:ATP-dependent Clp protease protease subunit
LAKPNWSFRVEAKAADDIEIAVYDIIGKSFWGDGVSASDVLKALRAAPTAKTISLRINSVGGFVDDAKAMGNLLAERAAAGVEIVAHVDGIAASAASYLLTFASRVIMPANAFQMIHQARAGVAGNATEMETAAGVLRKTNVQLAEAYAAASARRGKNKTAADYLAAFDKGDTYLTAAEAIEWGLADESVEPLKAAACLVDLTELGAVPAALLAAPYANVIKTPLPAPAQPVAQSPASAAPQPSASGGTNTKVKKMNEAELKAQHPDLYDAVFAKGETAGRAAGQTAERSRVNAHLKMAKTTGAVDVAHAAIASGASVLDEEIHADYMSASIARGAQAQTQLDSSAASAALDGTTPVVPAVVDVGDQIVARMATARGKVA